MDPEHEAELVRRWRAGDQRAGGLLFAQHFDEIYGFFCNRVRDPILAEDLVQQTFLSCVRNREAYRGASSFRTYVFTVARTRLIDHFRRRARAPELSARLSSLLDEAPSPSSRLRTAERDAILREAVGKLADHHRTVLELYYVQGFRGPELAEVLGVPEGTVRSRLRRAKSALEFRLRRLRLGERLA